MGQSTRKPYAIRFRRLPVNDVNDFVDILTNQLSMGARASADTTANAFSNLRNSTFELSAAIGDSLDTERQRCQLRS